MTSESAEPTTAAEARVAGTVIDAKEQLRIEAEAARKRLLEAPIPPHKQSVLYTKLKAASTDDERMNIPELKALLHKSGYRSEEELAREHRNEERQKAYYRAELAEKLRADCGVRDRYADADLDDDRFVADKFPEALEAYRAAAARLAALIERPGTVICHGKNGPGKSHQVSALVNRFLSLGKPARYDTADRFFLRLTSTFGAKGSTKEDLIKCYERYQLLVIDEYEVRGDSKFHEQILRSLIDARYADLRSTLIVTNLDIEDINDRLPRSVKDRIRGSGDVIHYHWGSLRRFGEER